MQIKFLKYRKLYFSLSGALVIGSIICLSLFGLSFGIDFTGGSIMEIRYEGDLPTIAEIKSEISSAYADEVYIQLSDNNSVIMRMKDISEETHQAILQKMGESREIEELRFESIGAVIGRELKQSTQRVIIFSLLAITIYIALAFSKLSWPAKSWQYGLSALVTLAHNVILPLGVFAVLGKYYGVQVTIPVVVALLTVVGYSINDTVVVFDRIRENITKKIYGNYEDAVNASLNQTLSRSINTSLTVLFVLTAIFFLGGETLKYFALALIVGVISGTYASIFLASPMLVSWLKWRKKI